jgi:hypothetical protein
MVTCGNVKVAAAGKCLEAVMAALITLVTVSILVGAVIGAFLKLSFAIRREDKRRSLSFDPSSASERAARAVVGVSGSRWG